jgi:MarR family transcriptional regulator, organic hydroperoxide resistance regulator
MAARDHGVPEMSDPRAMLGPEDENVPDGSREDELNLCIMDALSQIVKRAAAFGQELAQGLGLSVSDLVGLHKLEEPMTMKELGQRMHCDPSFVSVVTNGLEKHGLARRETCERDRRIKHVTLTAEGASMRQRLEKEFATRTPWAEALDTGERECLLTLLRKMISAADSAAAHQEEDWQVTADEPATTGGDPATN